MNVKNFGIAEGYVTRDPQIFENKDGSRKVMFTIGSQQNFINKNTKERETDFIQVEAFLSKDKKDNSVYEWIFKGSHIAVQYTVRTSVYQEAGKDVYKQVLFIESVDLKDTKERQDMLKAASVQAPAKK